MVAFRRIIPVLAVVAFLLGSAVTASAQNPPLSCFATGGVSTPARSEGLTELLGDYVLNCQGGIPTPFGALIPSVTIQIFLNTALTSRLLTTSTTGNQFSEALLLLDEPAPGAQFACNNTSTTFSPTQCNGYGDGVGNNPNLPPTFPYQARPLGYYGSGTTGASIGTCVNTGVPATSTPAGIAGCPGNNRNVFQAIQTTSNSVTFIGVPIDPPGSNNTRIIRITNLRGNANALGVAGANATPTPIVATLSPTPAQFLPVNNPSQTVAFIQKGLTFGLFTTATGTTASTTTNLQQCNSRTVASSTSSGQTAVTFLRYSENFTTAFKKRSIASSDTNPSAPSNQNNLTAGTFNTESGFVNIGLTPNLPSGNANLTSLPAVAAGEADWGTRVKAVFNNVPNGVSLYVDLVGNFNCSATAPTGQACSDKFILTSGETAAFSPIAATSGSPNGLAGTGTGQLTITNGQGIAVWEDVDSDPNTFATINFGVYVLFTAAPGSNSPALATTTLNGSYAPTSTVTIAANANVPRFADTSTATNVFTVVPCLTTLLFPFVTNQSGFDTGIAISATATDPFGTTPQSGTCTLNWYGAAFTGATPTPTINSGTTFATLVSTTLNNVTGGFQGYMIAVCRFQYAHGFAFVSDLGARNLAMGYLALVIPDPTSSSNGRLATPDVCGGASTVAGCAATGENLGQ